MKFLLTGFIALTMVTISISQNDIDFDKEIILTNYLSAINADNLDGIDSYSTKYIANTAMGEIVMKDVFFRDKISQKVYVAGNLMADVIAIKGKGCYNISNGVKTALPSNVCEDSSMTVGFFPEMNLLDDISVTIDEVAENDKSYYIVRREGNEINLSFYYDKETGIKVKDITTAKKNDQTIELPTFYKDYKLYDNFKFPESRIHGNFLGTGLEVEFKLAEVKYNLEDSIDED